jgi:hypothetical protein
LGNTAIPAIRKNAKPDFAMRRIGRGREKHPVSLLTMDPSIILLRGTFYESDLRRVNPSSDLSGKNFRE